MLAVALGTAAPAPAQLSPQAAARLRSFVAAGYDPLTAPVDWYRQAPIMGRSRAWPKAPASAGNSALATALNWAEAQGSTALVVSRGGRLLAEHYWHGDGRDTRFNSQSMAKTVAALMVGIAIDRGELPGIDVPVGRYLAEWRNDPRGEISLGNLLEMASGLGPVDAGFGLRLVPENPAVEAFFGEDFRGPALRLPLVAAPGSRFDYNNDNIRIVTTILERRAGKSYSTLLSERLWQPLGLGNAATAVDGAGFAYGSSLIFARPIDWAAIGQLFLDGGRWGEREIVSQRWIAAMIRPGRTNKNYGLWTWVGDHQVGGTPPPPVLTPWQSEKFDDPGTILLNGFGGQRVYILPRSRLVIVRTGRTWPGAWDDSLLPNRLARAFPLPEGA